MNTGQPHCEHAHTDTDTQSHTKDTHTHTDNYILLNDLSCTAETKRRKDNELFKHSTKLIFKFVWGMF